MRTNVIYLTDNIPRDHNKYLTGKILQNYPIEIYKVWFVDKAVAEKEQILLSIRSGNISVKRASA